MNILVHVCCPYCEYEFDEEVSMTDWELENICLLCPACGFDAISIDDTEVL